MKKKIWLINHYATEMYKNKGGRHYWFAKELLKKGYEPTIICANTYHNSRNFEETGNQKYVVKDIDGIPFVFVKTKSAVTNGLDRIINMLGFYKNLFPVSKILVKKHGKPDIILASSVHPLTMVAGIKIARKIKVPCICEIRDLWPENIFAFNMVKENSFFGKMLIIGEHWVYKNADALIFTKEGDVDYIKERKWDTGNGGDIDLSKTHYINNGVLLKDFNYYKDNVVFEDDDLSDTSFNVIYTGAIRPVNNVMNLVYVANELKEHKDIKLFVFGDGYQLESIRNKAKELKLNNIFFKGRVDKNYIPNILSKSSVNILNYSQDMYTWSRGNSSNKLFEYMASGKPVISTVKMGYSIIDKYKCGVEIAEASPVKIAQEILKIKSMHKEQYEKMGYNAAEGVKDFDFSVLTKKLVEVIENV